VPEDIYRDDEERQDHDCNDGRHEGIDAGFGVVDRVTRRFEPCFLKRGEYKLLFRGET
jgi:hypothetical protein